MAKVQDLVINAIRILSAEAIEKAKSGHPGLPMGAAPMAYALWANEMKHNPKNPGWKNRDRFILSAGHGSMLLYSLLHIFGYGLSIEDLKNFRQYASLTPGHPEYGHTAGVETTTGPLGQGFANGVGMALAEAYLSAKFNKPGYEIVDHYTFVLSGDGCMMEGITSEAASLAGTLGLGKLIVFYDDNSISIEGSTDKVFREDVSKRFASYGWQVIEVKDGNDVDTIITAIKEAKAEKNKPSLIKIKTVIGYGCPSKQGKEEVHGAPLGKEALLETKKHLNWDTEKEFYVPNSVYEHIEKLQVKFSEYENKWNKKMDSYRKEYPELAKELEAWEADDFTAPLYEDEEFWKMEDKPDASRNWSGEVLNRLAEKVPNLIGGSADLAPSNKSIMKNREHFLPDSHLGSNLHFGVREHAMSAISNGIALHGALRPYCATFFVFSDYMKGGMRLSAIMKLPVIYILTHDSIGVGEDGPTHEPIEHLAALRSVPNFTVFRPADGKETVAGWYAAMTRKDSPTALVLTRQKLPMLAETGREALKGAYILLDSEKEVPDIILIASGSEVSLIYEAKKVLIKKGIDARVVSMPSMELFEEQSEEYKNKILPPNVKARLAVEAASSFGWHKYVGLDGDVICIDNFGASGPQDLLFKKFGFTVENVVAKAEKIVRENK